MTASFSLNNVLTKSSLITILIIIIISCKKSDTNNTTESISRWTKIKTETGLRTNEILDLILDNSGNIWAAFSLGIGKYDGKTWTIYKPFPVNPNGASLDNYVQAIIQDRNGNIWATIENNQSVYACRFDGSIWFKWLLTGVRIPSIVEMQNGNIWFFSSGTGAYIYNSSNWSTSDCNGSCYTSYSALKDKNDNLWIGSSRSNIIKYDGNSFLKMTIPYTIDYGGDVVRISQANSGDIFTSLSPGGAWKLTSVGWQTILDPNYPTGPVLSILQDSKGRIWIGTMDKGVLLYDGSKVTVFDLDGEKHYITKILEDKNGVIWLGNSYGLFKYE